MRVDYIQHTTIGLHASSRKVTNYVSPHKETCHVDIIKEVAFIY